MLILGSWRTAWVRCSVIMGGLLQALILACGSPPVQAHFTHLEPRIIHVSPQPGGIQLLLRMPLPLLLLDRGWRGVEEGQAVPYTRREKVAGQWLYRIETGEFSKRFDDLEQRVLNGYQIYHNGQRVEAITLTQVHVFNSDRRRPFSSLVAAESAFGTERVRVEAEAVELFDSGIDLRLFIPAVSLAETFSVESELGAHLNVIDRLANILQVHDGSGESVTYSSVGPLKQAFTVEGGALVALLGQLQSGFMHILIGLDHVLFVLLIALASKGWMQTLQRATAFTLGHSVTLALGVIGHVPAGGWFIPLIETLIALTIFFAGIAVATRRQQHFSLGVILFVGLIHGFGFSIVLSDLVNEAGGLSAPGLLAFNLGIEIGQLVIYAAFALCLWLYSRVTRWRSWDPAPILSLSAVLVAVIWIYERGSLLLSQIQSI